MPTTEHPEPPSRPPASSQSDRPVTYAYLRSDGTAYVVWGSAIAGIAAYAYQLLGGRVLGAERFAPVSVLLTIHFLTFIVVMLPIEQLVVRRLNIDPGRDRLPTAAWWVAGATAAGATVVALGGVDRFLAGDARFVGFTLLTVVVHFVFATARGHLAGWRRFREYGLASGAASLLRLGAAIAVTSIHPSASGFAVALIAGPLVVFLWRPFRRPSATPGEPKTPDDDGPTLLGGLILASAASQALLLAGPLLVGMLGGSAVEVSVAFACFTVGRAPLVFGYNLLARVLGPFTRMAMQDQRRELTAWARGMAVSGLALAAIATLIGWLAGPWVVRAAFGPEFVVDGSATALIAAGVVLAGAGLFVGQVLVADGRTGRLALAWSAGLAAAVGTLLIQPGTEPIARVASAFLVGEAAALAALVVGAVSRGERRPLGVVAYEASKRTMDIAVSLTLLVVLAPLLALVGVVVRIDSPGPIFFRQVRVGRDGRRFPLVKIRTMQADADEAVFAEHIARLEAAQREGADEALGIEGDDRTTRVGGVLRRWSVDELPNLWNVAKGSMSLVGPRPLVPEEAALVGPNHVRFTVKPGITGLAQVNGRDTISMAERTRLDEEYVAHRSTATDLRILAATAGAIRSPRA